VHINSGIPNHAFYRIATQLGGYAWERAGRIWYETLRDSRVRPNTGFVSFARRTVANAALLFGPRSEEEQAVRSGWSAVGIDIS
jgi:Zn-dependent metalloprotease